MIMRSGGDMFRNCGPIRRALRRFGRARRGMAAVEFALVVIPFFLLTFGLAEVSMIGFAQTSLDFAVAEVARKIKTGENQLSGRSYSDIQAELCSEFRIFLVLDCNGNLYLDVTSYPSFEAAAEGQASPIQNGQFQADGFGYSPGAPADIVVVRAYYRWQVMTPLFQPFFQNVGDGQRILVSTMMFRDEPYETLS
jgi:Flp pilus assembly protein TadG